MRNHNDIPAQTASAAPNEAPNEAPSEAADGSGEPPWQFAVNLLLSQAAALCVANGVDLDTWMSGAWSIYVEARPGMRDQLEEMHLRGQLDELRRLGRLASA